MLVWTSLSLVRMDPPAHALQALKDALIMDLYAIHLALAQFFSHVLMDQNLHAMNALKRLISAMRDALPEAPMKEKKLPSGVKMVQNAPAMKVLKVVRISALSAIQIQQTPLLAKRSPSGARMEANAPAMKVLKVVLISALSATQIQQTQL